MLRLAALLCLLASSCARDKGAVVVRWRVVDAATGELLTSCSVHGVTIDHVRLRIVPMTAGGVPASMDAPCDSCCSVCTALEHTTNFELAPGDYKLWIEPLACGFVVGEVPPALVRTVTGGEITNLNAVEIRIQANAPAVHCDADAGVVPMCPSDRDAAVAPVDAAVAPVGDASAAVD
jgi:hypothetical protein